MPKDPVCGNTPALPCVTRRTLLAAAPAMTLAPGLAVSPASALGNSEAQSNHHPVSDLPFVRDATSAERATRRFPRIFWAVSPTGDYFADCDTGKRYGRQALKLMRQDQFAATFTWAVLDMIAAGREPSGIEIGFLEFFAEQAMAGGQSRTRCP